MPTFNNLKELHDAFVQHANSPYLEDRYLKWDGSNSDCPLTLISGKGRLTALQGNYVQKLLKNIDTEISEEKSVEYLELWMDIADRLVHQYDEESVLKGKGVFNKMVGVFDTKSKDVHKMHDALASKIETRVRALHRKMVDSKQPFLADDLKRHGKKARINKHRMISATPDESILKVISDLREEMGVTITEKHFYAMKLSKVSKRPDIIKYIESLSTEDAELFVKSLEESVKLTPYEKMHIIYAARMESNEAKRKLADYSEMDMAETLKSKWFNEALSEVYDGTGLTFSYIKGRTKQLEAEPDNAAFLREQEKKIAHIKELKEKIAGLKGSPNENEIPLLEKELNSLELEAPFAKHQIRKAHLKEQATLEAYEKELPKRIAEGFYDPAVIPVEMRRLLEVTNEVPDGISTAEDAKRHIYLELDKFRQDRAEFTSINLTPHQIEYITDEVNWVVDQYLLVYPERNAADAFVVARDLARTAVYQEHYDKSSFSGSDHGAKHIHNNIGNAEDLHDGMARKDFTTKDQLIEHVVHFYHDVGYTVGLATQNFTCSKDHPLVGAKMIEANQDYFKHYFDEESYEAIHKSVLYHAIALPDLTPDAPVGGLHSNLVRAVTSISDACAVTYDRKTQEFWEQPEAILALSRLKLFLIQFPRYQKVLSDKQILKDPWAGLDQEKKIDVIAHNVFQRTLRDLHILVNKASLPSEKKALFKQAIDQQFNAFTAYTTLGQYGATLSGLSSVENRTGSLRGGQGPTYLPKVNLAPSIVYGVLKDLFGADQSDKAFKSLVEEFGGDVNAFRKELHKMGKDQNRSRTVEDREIETGNAVFVLEPNTKAMPNRSSLSPRKRTGTMHRTEMDLRLLEVWADLYGLYEGSFTFEEKNRVLGKLEALRFEGGEIEIIDAVEDMLALVDEGKSQTIIETKTNLLKHLKDSLDTKEKMFTKLQVYEKQWAAQFAYFKEKYPKVSDKQWKEFRRDFDKARAEHFMIDNCSRIIHAFMKKVGDQPLLHQDLLDWMQTDLVPNGGHLYELEQEYLEFCDLMRKLMLTQEEIDFISPDMSAKKELLVGE